jgi:hypothetical protein
MKTEEMRSKRVPATRRERLATAREIAVLEYRLMDLEGVWYGKLAEIATSDDDDGCSAADRRQLSRLNAAIRILEDRLAQERDVAPRYRHRADEGFSVTAGS